MPWESIEERLAKRLIERTGLVPPIDVEALTSRYADVISCSFPITVDGVTVGLKQPGRRPRVYINEQLPLTRRRFTLAHELGHILMPNHVGSIVDELDNRESHEEPRYWEMEAEANRFAAELLMPSAWAKTIIGDTEAIAQCITILAQTAQVSIDAAVLKALKVGPAGFILAKSDGALIAWSGRTEGTLAYPPRAGAAANREAFAHYSNFGTNAASEGSYLWWRVADRISIPPQPSDDWRELLRRVVDSTSSPDKAKLAQSLNGIISAANGSVRSKRSPETVYSACLQRLQNRTDTNPYLATALQHPDFESYVIAKVYTFKF